MPADASSFRKGRASGCPLALIGGTRRRRSSCGGPCLFGRDVLPATLEGRAAGDSPPHASSFGGEGCTAVVPPARVAPGLIGREGRPASDSPTAASSFRFMLCSMLYFIFYPVFCCTFHSFSLCVLSCVLFHILFYVCSIQCF